MYSTVLAYCYDNTYMYMAIHFEVGEIVDVVIRVQDENIYKEIMHWYAQSKAVLLCSCELIILCNSSESYGICLN